MRAWFVMLTADGNERPFCVHRTPTVVGRAAQCDLRVPIPSVEPRHCELRFTNGAGWQIATTCPEAQILVNGKETRESILASEDRITIGPVNFVMRYSAQDRGDYDAITETKPVSLPSAHASRDAAVPTPPAAGGTTDQSGT